MNSFQKFWANLEKSHLDSEDEQRIFETAFLHLFA